MASLRLLRAPGLSNGRYQAAVEIEMAPGAHTYWKQPGQAGVPPVFAFNGSVNVAKADVLFPVPSQINEAGISANGYTGRVVFPVIVTPHEPGRDATLHVDVNYAVCTTICLPKHETASLDLSPSAAGLSGNVVLAALSRVPRTATSAEQTQLAVTKDGKASPPTWTVTWTGEGSAEDLFADFPEGFYFETHKLGPNRFSLVAVQTLPAAPTAPVPVSLTLARSEGALTFAERLDAAAPSR